MRERIVIASRRVRDSVIGRVAQLPVPEPGHRPAYEVVIQPFRRRKTLPQNDTLWMWHTDLAVEINVLQGRQVDAQWVHDHVFKPKFMPSIHVQLPDNTVRPVPMGTSDPACTVEIMSRAMDEYLAWLLQLGVDVRVPEDKELGWAS